MKRMTAAVFSVVVVLTVVSPLSARAQWRDQPDALAQVEMMKHFVEVMGHYLEISEKWMGMIEDKEMATYLAVERLVEIHKEKGDTRKAVPALKDLQSKSTSSDKVKTAIQFKIVEIYKEAGDHENALKENDVLLKTLAK
jgi:lipopolysaccharide biosynthesis regulator YciM